MINKKKINEIREWLHKSQNPLFFFDNDVDGLASFLLLRKYIDRGRGVSIKSFPELDATYTRKLYELKPDVVFILDKPLVAKGFVETAKQLGMPVIWIDHHPPEQKDVIKEVYYYNPLQGKPKSSEPVSYWCYQITKKDMWVSMAGCLSDWFLPEFTKVFAKQYPDIFIEDKDPARILFSTEFGKIIRILSFGLKDTTSNVVKLLKILWKTENPYDILLGGKKYEGIIRRYLEVNKKYGVLLEKAKNHAATSKKRKLLYFQYGGDLSISAELANELLYLYPTKIIAVGYEKGSKVSLSLRGGIDIRALLAKALEGTEGTGGGHKYACGATLSAEEIPKFKNNLVKLLKDEQIKNENQ